MESKFFVRVGNTKEVTKQLRLVRKAVPAATIVRDNSAGTAKATDTDGTNILKVLRIKNGSWVFSYYRGYYVEYLPPH